MTYAYIRVSTEQQGLDHQEFGIKEYCAQRHLEVDEWCEEKITGTKRYQDRQLGQLMTKIQPGDTLIVTEISRIGRKMTDILHLLEICQTKGIAIHAIKQGIVLDNSLNSKIMASIFAMCAEIERDLCSQRIKEKLASKKARGEKLGRPFGSKNKHSKLEDFREEIITWLEEGRSRYYIRHQLHCHQNTLNSFLLESGLADKYNIEISENFRLHGARLVKDWQKNKKASE